MLQDGGVTQALTADEQGGGLVIGVAVAGGAIALVILAVLIYRLQGRHIRELERLVVDDESEAKAAEGAADAQAPAAPAPAPTPAPAAEPEPPAEPEPAAEPEPPAEPEPAPQKGLLDRIVDSFPALL